MTEKTMNLADALADMQGQNTEPSIPEKWATPNEFIYRKYNRQTKVFLEGTNEACDSTDEIFATTKVALPEGNLNFVFREDIQMWQGYTAKEYEDYLTEIYVPTPTTTDEMQAAFTSQITGITKQLVGLTTGNAQLTKQVIALTQTNALLETRVAMLEKLQQQNDGGNA
ncbi:hypothetical protein JK159_03835 [Weissella minor]|uniref:hypothetical protein n=1 Tax=Weissella minor TaxID=1620 RepID=UPI001BB07DA5|nr:hypothetical protein [Weissella minor]MBS0949509.1 hypothetical protein [Weissella minor]